MENKPIARKLRLLSQLMELHDANPFKIKSVANAAFKVDKLPFPIAGKNLAELEKIDGIGKSIATKIIELLETESMVELDEFLDKTPKGVVEMMGIKGIGPKKVGIIWHELGIENIGELYYACNENRLVEAKGFGLKTQEDIRKVIEFTMAGLGKHLYAKIEPDANALLEHIKKLIPEIQICFAGDYRRCLEIIDKLVIVVGSKTIENTFHKILTTNLFENTHAIENTIIGNLQSGLSVEIVCVETNNFYKELFTLTGNEEHVRAILNLPSSTEGAKSEEAIYKSAGLHYIEPELREGSTYIINAKDNTLPQLINLSELNGSLHNHSIWSDGINTIEEMALYCRDELKLTYLGMCDHSKSAFYAKGLSIERVLQQQEEIDHLNKKLNGFKIFKGIESDILYDGTLDYPDDILSRFDFIVASVHSILKMDEEKATSRLTKAIENPYTTILGHPTGRLLLSRDGYPINYTKVIDACAANNVVIEINANPLRLDLDWRWQKYALDKGVWLSINPDAHRKEGFLDMYYGVLVARKGGLTKERCLNSLSLPEIESFFNNRKINKLSKS